MIEAVDELGASKNTMPGSMSMEFPDQSQFNRVRDALWQRTPSATVMVGSGFSRNAEKTQPGTLPAPTWRDLTEAMCESLYPRDDGGHRTTAMAASAETSGALRLAQEYEAAFGRTDLHNFLRMHVRDDQLRPGELHRRLLALPWRDVFTTNWDTLLERTRSFVPDRSYSILSNLDEIPLAASPRIVKLHGSLDGRFPLTFTEEDYRTYPDRFAPFVNTVQQSMMESIFCLIGFSGDDPNFLHWSGWVRDNLRMSAPKIYLAGFLNLSVHRQRMLEARNVIPIDLAKHPQASRWPQAYRHERATEWIVTSLEAGRPYEVSDWPTPSHRPGSQVSDYLEPVQRVTANEPKSEETLSSEGEQSAEGKRASVRKVLDVWSHNRKETYPGWLTAPNAVRNKMRSAREDTATILEVLAEFPPLERLNAIRELIWRWEIQLEPISLLEPTSAKLEQHAQDVLALVDCQNRKVDGEEAPDVNWEAVREAWTEVALALVTAARLRFDEEEFEKRISTISPFQNDIQEVAHRIRHEQCLWAIFSLDYASLKERLREWNVSSADPAWMMRKAAMLFEIGDDDEGQDLNSMALERSRQSTRDDENIGMLSREAWALYCAGATLGYEEFWYASIEWRHRWDQLTPLKCNTPLEMRLYAEAIKGQVKPEKGRPFDLGNVWRGGFSVSREEYLRWAAAHRAVRLPEVVGLPPTVRDRVVASDNLELAARRLVHHEQELAVRLVLRVARNENHGALNFVLSRVQIATMPESTAHRLAQVCVDAVEYIVPHIESAHTARHWAGRLAVIMESLSRLSVRLDANQAGMILEKAVGWYRRNVVSRDISLADPMRNLISRLWETLPVELRAVKVVELLGAPIVGLDGFSSGHAGDWRYADICEALKRRKTSGVLRTEDNNEQWQEVVGYIDRAMRTGGEARRRASSRLGWVVDQGILNAEETAVLSQALWGTDHEDSSDLPSGTDIFDWAFMVLPEPRSGLAEQRFRAKWLRPTLENETEPRQASEILWEVGAAIGNLAIHGIRFSLSAEEKRYLAGVIERWARKPIPVPLPIAGDSSRIFAKNADEDIRKAIAGLQHILLEVDVSVESANVLLEKFKKLNLSEMPARTLSVGLVKALPECQEDALQSLRMGLASDDTQTATNAMDALDFWLRAGREEGRNIPLLPLDLVREVGVIIATRRKAALVQALQVAEWIFASGSMEQRSSIEAFVVQGLGYLFEELRYDIVRDDDLDVPLLRWGCTHLAIAMAENGSVLDPVVTRWVENADKDPLPEIRIPAA